MNLTSEAQSLIEKYSSQELETNWLPLTTEVAAAFVYNTRFSDFKQRFDPWLKWHISLVKPDQHD